MKYCLDIKCIQDHCKYGSDGSKKAHVSECPELHCYACFKHNVLELDKQGLVKSFYCKDCNKNQVDVPTEGKPRTIKEMQAKLKQLKGSPIKEFIDIPDAEIEDIFGAKFLPPNTYKDN